ncbi:MAG: A24 family peptidase [Actinomycetes bacterium]
MDKGIAIAVCLVACITDLRCRRIPNSITYSGLVAVVLVRIASQGADGLEACLTGLATGIPVIGLSLKRPDGFGMGDAKLILVLLAAFGTNGVWGVLIACAGGAAWGCVCGARARRESIPLAPFIAAGAIAATIPW